MSFQTTQWSIVLKAQATNSKVARSALEELCSVYWQPLYAFARSKGNRVEEAKDLTQEFFARFIEKDVIRFADPDRGRFRTFLLTSLKNFLSNEQIRARAQKRLPENVIVSLELAEARNSFQPKHASGLAPDEVYEREWALAVLRQGMELLRRHYEESGKLERFRVLSKYLTTESKRVPYAEAAAELQLSEGAVKVSVHRMRTQYRQCIRTVIADTVSSPDEVDGEIQYLLGLFSVQ